MPEFVIPAWLNRNDPKVQAMGTPAFTGRILLDYLAVRAGWPDLGGRTVLDIGCGTRFASALLTYAMPIGRYFGVDVDPQIIKWLKENTAAFPSLSFHHVDHKNPTYNPNGSQVEPDWSFASDVDVCCMFSLITHQLPQDAIAIFREAHRRVRPDGLLFFSAHIHASEEDYVERGAMPTNLSSYSLPHLKTLLAQAGWRVVSVGPEDPQVAGHPIPAPIKDNYLCTKIL